MTISRKRGIRKGSKGDADKMMMGKKGTVCPTHDPDTKRIRALIPNLT